jgi:threonyl-tRNA synthetase
MLTRVYGTAFESKDDLQKHLEMLEEAKRRDHRVLGKNLKLFTISNLIGAGLPLLQPKGMVIRQIIEEYLWDLHKNKELSTSLEPSL